MRYALILLLLSGCASATLETRSEAFDYIGSDYVYDQHDCDDMSQEFGDWLSLNGVSREDMRYASATHNFYPDAPAHFWLEVRGKNGWRIFDVAGGEYGIALEGSMHYDNYNAHYIPSERVYIDAGPGYMKRWDHWRYGEWVGRVKTTRSMSPVDHRRVCPGCNR